ncbi:riboflavin synthase alpha chain [Paenibacillus algorifonticola]|uniref:Riboflavin synthase n=1 Tax=Paenibacillus algorifonticola TaxID=684063 RepID=A0A1I2EIN8_9BACL|nr:riboflavin synthase [Paenibacillus algorifonticola]SFE92281.1 riboflavin synthase alpha chain [Paenibacillus algorifonticola]
MFTGLIEEVGKLKRVVKQGEAMVVTIAASRVLEGVALGDSIAVNGVCLTVISFTGSTFDADVMPETYRRSNLHQLKPGEQVNLERAMLAGGRFGGHMVQGHIDGTGVIAKRETDANAVIFSIKLNDAATLKYVIPKGSIAIDGISLTVVGTNDSGFSVSVIPHTLGETALLDKRIGDSVNIECDMIGKYVEHLLHFKPARDAGANSGGKAGKAGGAKLSAAFLSENGFM